MTYAVSMAKKATKKSVKKTSKPLAKKAAGRSNVAAKKPVKKPAKNAVKKSAKKVAKKPAKKAVKKALKVVAKPAGKAVKKRPASAVAKATKSTAAKAPKEAARKPTPTAASHPMAEAPKPAPVATPTEPTVAGPSVESKKKPTAPKPAPHASFVDRTVDDAEDQMLDEDVPDDEGQPAALERDNTRPKRVLVSGPLDAKSFAIESARLLGDNHCSDILVLDLSGETKSMADYLVIGTGTSDRQMRSTLDDVADLGELTGHRSVKTNADPRATWILADFVDVVVHLFEPNTRAYYDLEMLWGDAPRIAWER